MNIKEFIAKYAAKAKCRWCGCDKHRDWRQSYCDEHTALNEKNNKSLQYKCIELNIKEYEEWQQ